MGDNEILARFGPSIDAEFEIDELSYGQLEAWNGSENQSTAQKENLYYKIAHIEELHYPLTSARDMRKEFFETVILPAVPYR